MGVIIHDAIVVTSSSFNSIQVARHRAEDLSLDPTTVSCSKINSYYTFLIPPDGSKEGWAESDEGNKGREHWKKWAREQEDGNIFLEWVEVSYGPDLSLARVNEQDTLKPEDLAAAQATKSYWDNIGGGGSWVDVREAIGGQTATRQAIPKDGDIQVVDGDGEYKWVSPDELAKQKIVLDVPVSPVEKSEVIRNLSQAYRELSTGTSSYRDNSLRTSYQARRKTALDGILGALEEALAS